MDEEIINLATYDFDTTKLEASLERLQKGLFETQQRQKEYASQMANITKEQKELEKEQAKLTASGERESEQYKENSDRLKQLRIAQEGVFKSQKDLQIASKSLNTEYASTAKSYAARLDSEGRLLTATERATSALEAEISSIESARAANSQILTIRNQLNPAIEEEAALIKQLNSQYDANINYIKENASAYENVKMNIGDYTKSIVQAYNQIEEQKKALEELNTELSVQRDNLDENSDEYKILNQQINNNITQINVYASDMRAARGETEETSEATDLLSGSLGGFIKQAQSAGGVAPLITGTFAAMRAGIIGATQAGIAFIATPLGAAIAAIAVVGALLVGAFKFMTASMNSTEEGSQKLAKNMARLSGFFNSFFKILKPVGEFLGESFIAILDTVSEALEAMFDGLTAALDFVGFDDAANSLRGFKNEVKESSEAAYNLAEAEGDLDEAMRKSKITQLDYQKQAEKLRQQRDDETKSIPQRIALNNQLGVVLKNQLNDELALANQRLKVSNLNIKSEGATKEALDQRAEALAEIADIQERLTGQESEQLANANSLRKEAASLEKEQNDKRIAQAKANLDAQIKNMDDELKYFIALQEGKALALEDSLKLAKGISERETAINEIQYKKGLISKQAYELKKLEIQNEYTASAANATIENTNLEIELFKERNKSLIDENKFFSDEMYKAELERLTNINNLEKEALAERYSNNLISQQEYQLAALQLENTDREEREALKIEREEAAKEKAIADLEIQRELDKANLDYDLAASLEAYEQGYNARKAAAIKAGTDLTLFEKQEAANRKAIEKAVTDNKIQLASTALGQISSIFGEQSKIGKAAAIAQTTIDTYQSAMSAYKGMVSAIPGPIGIAAGAVAAAASIALGFSNIKKITAVKTAGGGESKKPSYATGVIGLQGSGTGISDNIPANLSLGESVITAQATSMFPNTLSAINMLGGGAGIDENSMIQSNIMQDSLSGNMSSVIAEAVAAGAAEGTARGAAVGITNLSDNREIQKNAKF